MGLEDYNPEIESSEGAGNTVEVSKEASEKYKESSRKAGAKIAKTRKDEKKAKKYDFLLAGFLVKIIVDKKYDVILDSLFKAIHLGYSSNFILGILSLINLEISNKIREVSNNQKIIFNYEIKKEIEEFDDKNISPKIKDRINSWVEDIVSSVTIEYSSIQTKKIKILLEKDKNILINYTSNIFSFFLKELNVSISTQKSCNISEFILLEAKKAINKLKIDKI